MSKRKSDVWDFFNITNESSDVARCKLCKKDISRGGKSRTTSNLIKHLKLHHQREFYQRKLTKSTAVEGNIGLGQDETSESVDDPMDVSNLNEFSPLSVDIEESQTGSATNIVSPTLSITSSTSTSSICSPPGSASSSTWTSPMPKTYQPTLQNIIKKKTKLRSDDSKAISITKKITEMICLDNQPLSVVEDIGFKNLLNHLEPRYEIPKRKYFSTVALPKLYEETKVKVVNIMKSAKHISITTDMWTSTANDDYMSITCHFVDSEGKWNHICLEVVPFPEISHTSEAICMFLTQVLTDWNIINKLHVVVRDNGRNIVAALNAGAFKAIPCLAHTMQLVIKDGLLGQRSIANLSAVCRKTVGHFKHSAKATKALKAAQTTLGLPKHKLIQDEPTRWNSTKHMMDRLIEQRRAISLAAPDLNLPTEITAPDWELMANIVKVMKIFDDATFQSSSSLTTISEVIPIVNSAIKELENLMQVPGIKTFATELVQSLNTRYADVETVKEYTIETLLDPRLKGAVFISPDNLRKAKRDLLEETELLSSSDRHSANIQLQTSSSKTVEKMWQRYSVLMADTEISSENSQMSAEHEMTQYFLEPLEPHSCNIWNFWKLKCLSFPRLGDLAIKYLSAPPATVFSERLFSTSGIICDRKRNRLDPHRVQMLVFLNKNLKIK